MAAGVSASRRSVINLITAVCLVAVSCSDRELPTSPGSSSPMGKAAISGTLLAASDGHAGGATGAGQPLSGVTVRVASTGQTAETDAAGNFTLVGVSPGTVGLDFRGAGIQASTTVNASPGVITKVTVTVNRGRGRGTVSLTPRSDGIEGTVDSIILPASFVLKSPRGMVTIQTDSATQLRKEDGPATFTDIKTGVKVEVEGTRQNDGSVLASRVNVEGEDAEEQTKTPTGMPATTTTATTPQPTRTPTPTRTPEVEGADLEGTVGGISGSTFMLMTRSGPVTIQTNPATQFRNDDNPATFGDIKPGIEVEVKGTTQPDSSVVASRVSLKG